MHGRWNSRDVSAPSPWQSSAKRPRSRARELHSPLGKEKKKKSYRDPRGMSTRFGPRPATRRGDSLVKLLVTGNVDTMPCECPVRRCQTPIFAPSRSFATKEKIKESVKGRKKKENSANSESIVSASRFFDETRACAIFTRLVSTVSSLDIPPLRVSATVRTSAVLPAIVDARWFENKSGIRREKEQNIVCLFFFSWKIIWRNDRRTIDRTFPVSFLSFRFSFQFWSTKREQRAAKEERVRFVKESTRKGENLGDRCVENNQRQ